MSGFRHVLLISLFSGMHSLSLYSKPPAVKPLEGKVVVCTRLKNEMAYLPEWIAYHRILGVDHFEIYNDQSADGVEMLPDLYKARGHNDVSVRPGWNFGGVNAHKLKYGVPKGTSGWPWEGSIGPNENGTSNVNLKGQQDRYGGNAQYYDFSDCVERHRDAAFVGSIDVDEFIVVERDEAGNVGTDTRSCDGPHLKCLLAKTRETGFDAVDFETLRFGTNGNKESLKEFRVLPQNNEKKMRPADEVLDAIPPEQQSLDCSDPKLNLVLNAEGVWERKNQGVNSKYNSEKKCFENPKKTMATVLEAHRMRGPLRNEDVAAVGGDDPRKYCDNSGLTQAAGGTPICDHWVYPSKQFCDPQVCMSWRVHGGQPLPGRELKRLSGVGNLNHYYLRSAEDTCLKQWGKLDTQVIYKWSDGTFFNAVADDRATKLVDLKVVKEGMAELVCP